MSNHSRLARRLATQLHDLRDAARSMPDALALVDVEEQLQWANPAAEQLLGLQWPRDRGLRLTSRYPGDALGRWLRDGGHGIEDIASPTVSNVQLQCIFLPYGNHRRLLLARDISQITRLERVRRDFVANVSHELRTPLTVIHGYLEALEPEDVPALAPVLDELRGQSQRMRHIVEDLLTLSHLEAQGELPSERVAMAPLLASLRSETEALSRGRHQVAVGNTAGVDLTGSPKDLRSAFSNLASNAVRYTPDGGRITIRWQRTAAGAEYVVGDSGQGIRAEHLARLTERFYHVSTSRSRASGGTGVGLSIVKHVLDLHQAKLRITSEPGRGSTFSCRFDATRIVAAD